VCRETTKNKEESKIVNVSSGNTYMSLKDTPTLVIS
jgi:hypothetical protein